MSFTVSIGRDGGPSDQTVKFHVGGPGAQGQGQGQNMRVRVGPGKPGGMAITLGNPVSPGERVVSPGGAVAFKLGGQQRPQPEGGMSYSPVLTPTLPLYSGQPVGRETPDGAVTIQRAGTPMSDTDSDAGGKMAQTYRSEIFIPIHKDELSFEERQRRLWQDMDTRIEQRRMEWESEIERMRTEFFSLKPLDMGTRMGAIERTDNLQTAFEQGQDGTPRFKIRFDVQQFNTDEIKVQTFERRLIVKAKHTETRGNTTVSREFSRQVDLPGSVDVQSLQASVSKDGILVVEAPVQTPQYQQIQHHQTPIPSLRSGPNTSPIVTNPDGSRQLKLEVEIGIQYTADDVIVKTVDRKIVINARHEEKSGNRTSFCEFSKEYELPESVDPFTVNAYLLDNGKLIVEAPLRSQAPPPPPPPQSHRVTITVQRQ
ncbi:major egg antigen-like [Tubulanus polymorphus]|uniref:major egg antigen-like n=1 Tax=Tubulanus polymorphus TaxID=672921 RepID=UPI003DA5F07C